MESMRGKYFTKPDETRVFPKGRIEIVRLGGVTLGLGKFRPGWRWSEHVKPIAGTPSCRAHHLGYIISGRMRVVMDNGKKAELGPGGVANIPPGHDAWVVGRKTCVFLDFMGMDTYANPAKRGRTSRKRATTKGKN